MCARARARALSPSERVRGGLRLFSISSTIVCPLRAEEGGFALYPFFTRLGYGFIVPEQVQYWQTEKQRKNNKVRQWTRGEDRLAGRRMREAGLCCFFVIPLPFSQLHPDRFSTGLFGVPFVRLNFPFFFCCETSSIRVYCCFLVSPYTFKRYYLACNLL